MNIDIKQIPLGKLKPDPTRPFDAKTCMKEGGIAVTTGPK